MKHKWKHKEVVYSMKDIEEELQALKRSEEAAENAYKVAGYLDGRTNVLKEKFKQKLNRALKKYISSGCVVIGFGEEGFFIQQEFSNTYCVLTALFVPPCSFIDFLNGNAVLEEDPEDLNLIHVRQKTVGETTLTEI